MMKSQIRFLGLAALGAALLTIPACAEDWPKDYDVEEGATSPDGHYGIIVPGKDAPDPADGGEFVNYLVDVKAHHVLGKIAKSNYQKEGRRQDLHADWSTDSAMCVVIYGARFGYYSASVLVP